MQIFLSFRVFKVKKREFFKFNLNKIYVYLEKHGLFTFAERLLFAFQRDPRWVLMYKYDYFPRVRI